MDEYTVLTRSISLLLTQKFLVEILVAVNFDVTKNGSDSNKIITGRMWRIFENNSIFRTSILNPAQRIGSC